MFNDRGENIVEAGPSEPAEILGLTGLPEAGELFVVTDDDKSARQLVHDRSRQEQIQRASAPTMENVHTRMESGEVKALNLIVKTDVQGSVEAVRSALSDLSTTESRVNLVRSSSGAITESDVLLAVASQAIILGFNTQPEQGAKSLANQEGIEIRDYKIIYDLLDDIEKALTILTLKGNPIMADASVLEGRVKLINTKINNLEAEKEHFISEEIDASNAISKAADLKLRLSLINMDQLSQSSNGLVENMLSLSRGPQKAGGLFGMMGY